MELDPHQAEDNSCNGQKRQSRQDNPIVIVDGKCSESKYAYEKMSNISLYSLSLLTDEANISDF